MAVICSNLYSFLSAILQQGFCIKEGFAIKGLEFLTIRNLRCMLDDIARKTDVGVFYSFSGPLEIIIFHFVSLCSFPFRFIQPFKSQEFPQS